MPVGSRRLALVTTACLAVAALGAAPAGAAAPDPTEDVHAFGDASFHGSTRDVPIQSRIMGMAPTPSGQGYWLVDQDGGVYSYGDAAFHGSMGGERLNSAIVGMAATPSGQGYWLVAFDGGVFTFGDATFHGSTGDRRLNEYMVGMAAHPSGRGYWLLAADGGIFTFGDARFHGSLGDVGLGRKRITGMAATPGGAGYWTVADGLKPAYPAERTELEHGGATWAVVLAGGGATDDPAIVEAVRQATVAGYRTGPTDCDRGAAEALSLPPGSYTVSVYFDSEARARRALAAFRSRGIGLGVVAEVETFCLD